MLRNITRALFLPARPEQSYFLWGPRQVGKSYLLRHSYPESLYIDLLLTSNFIKYIEEPWLLRNEILAAIANEQLDKSLPIIIDEIQKVPMLLDEVHHLIENQGLYFILCGSSARKIRKGHANLLGGRALRYELYGFNAYELGDDFKLERILNHGYTPKHYFANEVWLLLESYVQNYLKEEIANEALVRKLPSFSNFLEAAALSDTEQVVYTNISRDCAVSANTVKEYYQILESTMIGRFLPAYTKRPKRRVMHTPKFYFSDVGIVNFLAKRKGLEPRTDLFGKAFENWVMHELYTYNQYRKVFWDLSYWRLTSGVEVDFIINNMDLAIEAKGTAKIHNDHLKGLRELIKDYPEVKQRIIVSLVEVSYLTDDGIMVLNYRDFVSRLWSGKFSLPPPQS